MPAPQSETSARRRAYNEHSCNDTARSGVMHIQAKSVSLAWRLLLSALMVAALGLAACDDGSSNADGDADTDESIDRDVADTDDVVDESENDIADDTEPAEGDETADGNETDESEAEPDESGTFVYTEPGYINNDEAITVPGEALVCLNDDMTTIATLSVLGLPDLDPVYDNIRKLDADTDMTTQGSQVFTWAATDENTYIEVWDAADGMLLTNRYGLAWNKPLEALALISPFKGYAAFEEYKTLLVFNPQDGTQYTTRELDQQIGGIVDLRGLGFFPAAGAVIVIARMNTSAAGAIWIDPVTDNVHADQPAEQGVKVAIPLGDATQGAVSVVSIEPVGDEGVVVTLDRAIVFVPAPASGQQPQLVANYSELNGSTVVDFLPDSPDSGWLLIRRDIDALLYAYRDQTGFHWTEEAVFDMGVTADLHRSPVTGTVYLAASHDPDGNAGGVFALSRSETKTMMTPVFTGWVPRRLATVIGSDAAADGDVDPDIDDADVADTTESPDSDPAVEQENDTVTTTLPVAIPDNNVAGIVYETTVSQTCTADAVNFNLVLVHPEIGDLRITAQRPDGVTVSLFDRAGDGPGLLLNRNIAVHPAGDLSGTWRIFVADLSPADTGTLESAAITPRCAVQPDGDVDEDLTEQESETPVVFTGLRLPALAFATGQDNNGRLVAVPEADMTQPFTADASLNPVASLRSRGNTLFVVEGRGADTLTLRDGAHDLSVTDSFSVGDGSLDANDVAVTDGDIAFVSRFGSNDIPVIDLAGGQSLGSVDLSAFADGVDGSADPVALYLAGNRLYVLLQHLVTTNDLRIPAGYGSIAVIDTDTLTVIDADPALEGVQDIALTCAFPVRMQAVGNLLYVACVNSLGLQDGEAAGIETVDLATMSSNGLAVTEDDLGMGLLDIAMAPDGSGIALGVTAQFATVVKAVNVSTATVGATLDAPGGWVHTALKTDDRGVAYLLYGDAMPGYRRYDLLRKSWIDEALRPLALPPEDVAPVQAQSPAALFMTTMPESGPASVLYSRRFATGAFGAPAALIAAAQKQPRLWVSPWHVFVADASGADMVDSFTAVSGLRGLSRLRAGNGSLLVKSVVAAQPDRAYVSRRGSQELLVFDPFDGSLKGTVDLSAFGDDADGRAEPGAMAIAGDYLYVEISGLDATNDFAPWANGRIALLDAATGALADTDPVVPGVQGIRLPAAMPDGHLRVFNGLAFVSASGLTDGIDAGAGLYAIDLASQAVVLLISETDLGGNLLDAALVTAGRGVALIENDGQRSLVTFDPEAGTVEASIVSPQDAMVYGIEPRFAEGLVLAATDNGVIAFDALAGQLILDLGPDGTGAVALLATLPVTGAGCAADAMCETGICQIVPGLCARDCSAGDGVIAGDTYCRSLNMGYVCHAEAMGMCAPPCTGDESCDALAAGLICGDEGYCVQPPAVDGDEDEEIAEEEAAEEDAATEDEIEALEDDTVAETELEIAEDDTAVETELEIAEDDTAVETELEAVEDDVVVETELEAVEDDTVVEAELEIAEDDTAVEAELEIVEDDTAVEAEIETVEDDTIVEAELEAVEDDTAVEAEIETVEDDTIVEAELEIAEDDTAVEAELETVEDDTAVETELETVEDDVVVETEIETVEDDTAIETEVETTL